MIYSKEAFNQMRQNKTRVHSEGCGYSCDICFTEEVLGKYGASAYTHNSINSLVEMVLCPNPYESTFHKLSCLKGECDECGSKRLVLCPREKSENAFQISVKVFEDVASAHQEGKKRKDLLVMDGTLKKGICNFTMYKQMHGTLKKSHMYFGPKKYVL
ncbi:hypothetical protein GOP47_0002285 [Adiantum capillus-veneris]|uniref:Uncharacterized protein n=1 Tax=Adiantum capillus-veneris TaxID=13818 RepID=A0A9D4VBT7_ADICA|nr:hypothetical protein GOP47_0002285 [Adiantum capillus-veneris]